MIFASTPDTVDERPRDRQLRHADAERAADQLDEQEALGRVELVPPRRRGGRRSTSGGCALQDRAAAPRSTSRDRDRTRATAAAARARLSRRGRRQPGSSRRRAIPATRRGRAPCRGRAASAPSVAACRRPGSTPPMRRRAPAPSAAVRRARVATVVEIADQRGLLRARRGRRDRVRRRAGRMTSSKAGIRRSGGMPTTRSHGVALSARRVAPARRAAGAFAFKMVAAQRGPT